MLHGVLKAGKNNIYEGKDVNGDVAVLGRCKGEFLSPAFIGEIITAEVTVSDPIVGKTMYEGLVRVEDRLICRVSGMGAMIKKSDAHVVI